MKLRKGLWLLLCLTFVMSLFLSACSKEGATDDKDKGGKDADKPKETEEKPVDGGDLIIGVTGGPTLFNPYYSTDTSSGEIENFLYNGLVKVNLDLETELDLAKEITHTDDGLEWTVKLRDDVKFHDGEPMTADDVVFSYNIPLQEGYVGERGSAFANVESVTKVDDYTVKFKLKQVDATFYPTTLGYAVLPEHILKDVPIGELGENEFNTKSPIGTGPFKFSEWKDGEYVKVVANDDYFEGRPHLDSVTYKIVADANAIIAQLQAGEIDMYAAVKGPDLETVKAIPGVKVEEGLALSYTYLGLNQKLPMFQDKKVRQAITMAINRKAIVESVMQGAGQVADVPESPLMWTYPEEGTFKKFEYDPEGAKKLLAEAGWKDTDGDGILDKDGKKFSFTIKTNQGNKTREDSAVVIQEQLKQVGIEATPEIVEWGAFIEQISAPNWDYEALILGWALSTFPDQYDIFHSSQAEEGLNFVWYKNEEADKLMEEARKTTDIEKYKEIHQKLYKILAEDQAYTYLYYPIEYRAMPENLMGYEFHSRIPYYNIHKWWLKQDK